MLEQILDFYDVADVGELIEQESAMLNDSLVDAFCANCGEYYDQLEPDASGITCPECGEHAVASLLEILLFG